ncbi:MAG TPA: DUF3237 family protein [Polyangiaceae bacterium]|nr:DUF3237 family protein [Polyangiaceae bacterium]
MAFSALARLPLTALALTCTCSIWGCTSSSGDSSDSPASGGTNTGGTGTGGTSTGGSTATGGSSGAPGTGGVVTSGGNSGTGGIQGTGGSTGGTAASTGGSSSTGGAAGAVSTGGGSGKGGSGGAGTSGALGTGGTAGSAATGGGAGKGGATATTGGSANTGGSAGGGTGSDGATLVPDPSWTCGMADGIPAPTAGTLAFSIALNVSATHNVGNTQFGKRRQLDVSGGTITGDKLKGTVMTGGLDYELTLSTGAMELEEVLVWKTSDNVSIFVRVCGVAAPGDSAVRIVPDIEAPTSGSASWLNTAKLVGTRKVDPGGSKITLDVYDVSMAAAGATKVQLKDPAGVPNNSWDCVAGSGTKGTEVLTENVSLGSSFSVSNAKRGSRNIIPITGGTTTGKVVGKILNGGADYQLAGSSGTTLDARYTLAPNDGNFIIVRNCGPINTLAPVFEAASDGPYAFLTTGKFLSSSPGAGAGGVSITFYERK